jgi:hypothetical protein
MEIIAKLIAAYHSTLADVAAAFENMLDHTDPKKHALADFMVSDKRLYAQEKKAERILIYIAHALDDANDDTGAAWQYVQANIANVEHRNLITLRTAKLASKKQPVAPAYDAWAAAGLS